MSNLGLSSPAWGNISSVSLYLLDNLVPKSISYLVSSESAHIWINYLLFREFTWHLTHNECPLIWVSFLGGTCSIHPYSSFPGNVGGRAAYTRSATLCIILKPVTSHPYISMRIRRKWSFVGLPSPTHKMRYEHLTIPLKVFLQV